MIGQGAVSAFVAQARPFFDRPDIVVPWLFYAVDEPWEPLPWPTVFTTTFWDWEDHGSRSVGVIPGSERPYFGPIPAPGSQPLQGSATDWLAGVSYADWEANGFSPAGHCFPLSQTWPPVRPSQGQTVPGVALAGPSACTVAQTATPGYRPPCWLYYAHFSVFVGVVMIQRGWCRWSVALGRWTSAGITPDVDAGLTLTFRPVGVALVLAGATVIPAGTGVIPTWPPLSALWTRRSGLLTFSVTLGEENPY